MTGKQWMGRLLGLVALVAITTTGAIALSENAEAAIEMFSPAYVPLSIEEKFRRAELPCKRPFGSSSGCETIARLSSSASAWDKANNTSYINIEYLSLLSEEHKNREAYVHKELKPKAEVLKIGLILAFALHLVGVAMYGIPLLAMPFDSRGNQGITGWAKRAARLAPLKQTTKEALHSRKLRQTHDEFKVMKDLYDNGLITEDVFLQRKAQIKARLAGNDVPV